MRFGSGRAGLLQDSTGSVIVQDGQQDDSIQMQSLSEGKMVKIMENFSSDEKLWNILLKFNIV